MNTPFLSREIPCGAATAACLEDEQVVNSVVDEPQLFIHYQRFGHSDIVSPDYTALVSRWVMRGINFEYP